MIQNPNINEYVQSVYYIVIVIIAYYTYRGAKKTIFQPMKTEMFKKQLESLSEVFEMFVGRGEHDLRVLFHFEKLFSVNTFAMYDEFAFTFYKLKRLEDADVPYMKCRNSIISADFLEANFELADHHIKPEVALQKSIDNPVIILSKWKEYKHGIIYIPDEMDEQQKKLRKVMANPVFPNELISLLSEFEKIVTDNIMLIDKILTESSQQMPLKYQTLDDLKNSTNGWIYHLYNGEFQELQPQAIKILDFIRSYLGSDKIYEL